MYTILSSQEIAIRLIRRALNRALMKGQVHYKERTIISVQVTCEQLKSIPIEYRYHIYDDITIIIIFIDYDLLRTANPEPQLSISTFRDAINNSGFSFLHTLDATTSNQPSEQAE